MIYLGNGIYSDSGPDTLAHYGVLGMKWGIRKDREFRSDLNWHEANKKIRANKLRQKEGSISKAERKRLERDIVKRTKAKNRALKYDYADYKPKKGAKIREIYEKNMKRAQSEIPYYKAKHAVRKGAKIAGLASAGVLGATGLGLAGAGAASGLTAAQIAQIAATYGTEAAIDGALTYNIPKRVIRGKM